MGSTSMYWISTLSYFFILSFIMIKDYKSTKKPGREEKSYRSMLSWVIYFCLQDTLWGLCDNDIIDNDSIFFIATMIFFISTVITTYFWLNFVLVYMNEKRRKVFLSLDVLLIIADIIILTVNIFIPIVFRIENGIYVTKTLRPFLFLNQYIAYVFICILSLIYWLKEESDNRSRYLSVFIFTCAPVLLGAFQFLYPYAPFYSMAYFLGCIIVHVLLVANDREKAEKAHILQPLIDTFYSMHLIDVENDTVQKYIEPKKFTEMFEGITGAKEMVDKAFGSQVSEEYKDAVMKFVNLKTLSERMSKSNKITMEFVGKCYGWTRVSFFAEEREGNDLKKVMLITRIIDEEKKRSSDLLFKSYNDELTGLNNRRSFETDLKDSKRKKLSPDTVFVSMDINELKSVNDNIGHDAGDELIVGASKCMKKVLAKYGKVYRTGGDEFCAIMYCGKTEPEKIIAKFKDEVNSWKGKHVEHLSVSTGYVAAADLETPNLRDMSLLADKLMYEDKSAYYRKKGVDRRGQKDSRAALCAIYSRILKINITKDEYQVISFDSDEKLVSEKISEVFAECARTCNIHPDDLEKYIAQTNMAYLKDYFARKKHSLTIYYRVKSGEEYVNKTIEMIPAEDYTDEDQNLYLYVRVVE